MGQYYHPISRDKKQYLYSHTYDSGLKLMEHSWLKSEFVNAVMTLLKEGGEWFKTSIVWAGDYADKGKHLTSEQIKKYQRANPLEEGNKYDNTPTLYDYVNEFGLEIKPKVPKGVIGKYIVNHTKKQIVSLKQLPKDTDGWTVHPLPLLTACGNGRGGGDFGGDNDFVGTWSGDVISVQDKLRGTEAAKFEKITPDFVEN